MFGITVLGLAFFYDYYNIINYDLSTAFGKLYKNLKNKATSLPIKY